MAQAEQMNSFDIIVIGGGPAGVLAALHARELGARVALVERGRMGGTCTNDGCVPARVLARSARLAREAAQFESFALTGEKPRIDFARLIERAQATVYRIHEKKQLVSHLTDAGARVYENCGDARFLDSQRVLLADGTHLRGEKFIICAGGHARRIPFEGSAHALTYTDVWSLRELPASVIIVGGAATGCQLASIFNAFGTRVTLLETRERILGAEDVSVSVAIHSAFERNGIEVITRAEEILGIRQHDQEFTLYWNQNASEHTRTAEKIFLSVGWIGNLDALHLDAAGVKTERGYVVVNDYLQSSVENIFAAGDITGRMMLVQSAGYDGKIAAENAVLGIGNRYQHQIVPHGGFTDPEYASVGLTEEKARAQADCVVATVPYAALDRAVIDQHTDGFCKIIVARETHRVLGAHVVGEQALENIHLVAAGMNADVWIEQIAEMEIAYPTYCAAVGLAARQIAFELGVMPLTREWRALGKLPGAEWERAESE